MHAKILKKVRHGGDMGKVWKWEINFLWVARVKGTGDVSVVLRSDGGWMERWEWAA